MVHTRFEMICDTRKIEKITIIVATQITNNLKPGY